MAEKKPKAPPPRNAGTEISGANTTASDTFNQRNPQLIGATTGNFNSLIGALTTARGGEIKANTKILKGDKTLATANKQVQDATRLYTQPTALSAQLDSAASGALSDPTSGNAELNDLIASRGPSPLLQTMQGQAQTGLEDNGQLTPEEARLATQGGRAAFEARGLGTSSPAALSEVLNRTNYVTQRQDRARAFAGSVEGLAQSGRGQDINVAGLDQNAIDAGRSFATSTNTGDAAYNQFALGAKTGAAQFRLATDPKLLAYQTPSMAPTALSGALSTTAQADVYPQVLQATTNVNDFNANATWSQYMNQLNRYYAQKYGGMGTTTAGAGGFNTGGALTGALSGAASGAVAGSVIPGVGTVVGGVAGGLIGGLGGGFS